MLKTNLKVSGEVLQWKDKIWYFNLKRSRYNVALFNITDVKKILRLRVRIYNKTIKYDISINKEAVMILIH